jgi:hypothetical protein
MLWFCWHMSQCALGCLYFWLPMSQGARACQYFPWPMMEGARDAVHSLGHDSGGAGVFVLLVTKAQGALGCCTLTGLWLIGR